MKRLLVWQFISVMVAIAACASGSIGLGIFDGGVHSAVDVEWLIHASFALMIAWFVILVLAAINLRWRALWVFIVSAPMGLLPLAFMISFGVGVERCAAHHPAAQCVP